MSRPLCPVSGSPGLPGWAWLHRLQRVRCPYQNIGGLSAYPQSRKLCVGSDVARRVIYPLTLGILPWPLCLASQAGKMVHKDE